VKFPLHLKEANGRVTFAILVQNLLWLVVALIVLPPSGHILYDEAFFYDRAVAVFHDGDFPVYGPFISSTNPTAYTPGGGLYLLLAPAFLLTRNPEAGTAWVILLTVAGNLIMDRALRAAQYSWRLRLIIGTLLVWAEWHARSSDRIWNVSAFWFLSLVTLSCCLRVAHRVGNQPLTWAVIGVTIATCLQVHLGAVLLMACCVILVLAVRRRVPEGKYIAIAAVCFVLMYVPYLISDGMHGWANLQHMQQGVPRAPREWTVLASAAVTPFRYSANLAMAVDTNNFGISHCPWPSQLHLLAVMVVFWAGFFHRSPLRYVAASLVPLILVYFFFSRREVHDHYLSSIYTTSLISFALGLDYLFERSRLKNGWLYAFLAVWSVYGTVQWLSHFVSQTRGSEVSASRRLDAIAAEAQRSHIYSLIPPTCQSDRAGENFVYHILTKRLYGFTPAFRDERTGEVWRIELGSATRPGEKDLDQGSHYYPVPVEER
jgi:hypothetical protein